VDSVASAHVKVCDEFDPGGIMLIAVTGSQAAGYQSARGPTPGFRAAQSAAMGGDRGYYVVEFFASGACVAAAIALEFMKSG